MCLKLRHGHPYVLKSFGTTHIRGKKTWFGQFFFHGLLFYFFVCKYGTITIRGFFPEKSPNSVHLTIQMVGP